MVISDAMKHAAGIGKLTHLGFFLNAAAGGGRYAHLSLEDAKREIEAGTLFDWLKQHLGADIDLSMLTRDDCAELLEEWQGLVSVADERKKMLVTKGALTLLVAYVFESIQQRI